MTQKNIFEQAFEQCGLVAILRGVQSHEIKEMGIALYDAGFRIIEVPLNSPNPFETIKILADTMPKDCVVGAGTVMSTEQVTKVREAGGTIIIMPHSDANVVRAAKAEGLFCMPGVATPTEGFEAFSNGADAVKLFPAELITPSIVKAWRAVFDRTLKLVPVGGVSVDNMAEYLNAGASGFGLGGGLYTAGMSLEEVTAKGISFTSKWSEIK
jgi:2-dehydro-3-deoxyphosphogalactonate aldolase